MKYDYHFNNETISIDILDSDYDVLIEMDRLEYNLEKRRLVGIFPWTPARSTRNNSLSDADVEVCSASASLKMKDFDAR